MNALKYLIVLVCSLSIQQAKAQLIATAVATESRCSATGSITITASGGLAPYIYEIVGAPPGFTRPPQSNPTFNLLQPGDYTISVKDQNSTVFILNISVPGDYYKPTIDSCIIKFSKATVYASGGRLPYRYTYSRNGGPFIAPQDTNVFDCLPNGDYTFRVLDSCENFYPASRQVNVPGVYFSGVCNYDSSGTTNITLSSAQGGEMPYMFFSVSNFGDTVYAANGNFTGLVGCNFTVFMYDRCNRSYQRYFDCPPSNLSAYVVCSNADSGTVEVKAFGGSMPYSFTELTSGQTNSTGFFSGLMPEKPYTVRVRDACGRTKDVNSYPIRVIDKYWTGCPFNGKITLRVRQDRYDLPGCSGACNHYFPYTFTCTTSVPPQVQVDSSTNNTLEFYPVFDSLLPGLHHFVITNGCGEQETFDLMIDTTALSVSAGVNCAGGIINAYASAAGSTFYLYDNSLMPLDTNTTGVFNAPYPGTFIVEATNPGCRSAQTTVSAFANPTLSVLYATCDSVSFTTCPNIPGFHFLLFDQNNQLVDTDSFPHFSGLSYGSTYRIAALHPQFPDTIWRNVTLSYLPGLTQGQTTCSSVCAQYLPPYGWTDQHNVKVFYVLYDSLGTALDTNYNNACFDHLSPDTKFKIVAFHPYCGMREVTVKTLPAISPNFCVRPTTATDSNGKCVSGWDLIANGSVTQYFMSGGNLPDTIYSSNGVFYNLLPGQYVLSTECTADSVWLPEVEVSLTAVSGPACPEVASIQAYGIRSTAEWQAIVDSAGLKICSGEPSIYNLYNENYQYLTQNYSGFFNYLNPGQKYYVVLVRNNCPLDTVAVTPDFYVRPDLTTSYGVICKAGQTTGSISCNLSGGRPPYKFEILTPAGAHAPINTNSNIAVFDNLPPDNYFIRASDGCGISADFTGTIGPLLFTPKATRFCDGTIEMEVPDIVDATYEWKDAAGTVVGTDRVLQRKDTVAVNYSVTVKTSDSCVYTTQAVLPAFSPVNIVANAGPDLVSDKDTIHLAAIAAPAGVTSKWRAIAPSTGVSQIQNPAAANTRIKATQFPGLYTFEWSLRDPQSGCIALDTMDVTFCQKIDTLDIQVVTVPSSCLTPTGSAVLTVSGGQGPIQFLWSTGDTSAQISAVPTGNYGVTVTDGRVCTKPAFEQIPVGGVVVKTQAAVEPVPCFGGHDGYGEFSASGGAPAYTYHWSDGGAGAVRNDLAAGIYSVTVTDSDGCTAQDSLVIQQPALLEKSQGLVLCYGEQYVIGNAIHTQSGIYVDTLIAQNGCDSIVTSDLFFKPLNEKQQAIRICAGEVLTVGTFSHNATGLYTDVLTGADGCDSMVVTNLLVKQIQQQHALVNMTCTPNGAISVDAQSNSGVSQFDFKWNTGSTDAAIQGLSVGTYTVTISNDGCSVTQEFSIGENPSTLQLSVAGQDLACFNDHSGTATVSAAQGATPYSIQWNTGAQIFEIQQLMAGNYNAVVTDGFGCIDSVFVTIQEPDLLENQITAQPTSCFGGKDGAALAQPVGGTAPYQFNWAQGLGNTAGVSQLQAGKYIVTISDSNGCVKIDSAEILSPALILQQQMPVLCAGDTLKVGPFVHFSSGFYRDTLSAVSGCDSIVVSNLFIKSAIQTDQTLRICEGETITVGGALYNSTGLYTDVLAAADGCDSTVVTDLLVKKITLTSLVRDMVCTPNGNIRVSAVSNSGKPEFQFNWSTGASTDSIGGLAVGIYTVTVSNDGCAVTGTVTVAEQPDDLSLSTSVTDLLCNGIATGAVDLSIAGGKPGYAVQWNTGAQSQQVENLAAGVYSVSVTDAQGCLETIQTQVKEPPPILYPLEVLPPSCYAYSDAMIEIGPISGGTGAYHVLLDQKPVNQLVADHLVAGEYLLELRDDNGCIADSLVIIPQPAPLVVVINGQQELVLGDSVFLQTTVSGNAGITTFSWFPPTALSCPVCPETWTNHAWNTTEISVNIADENGCAASDTILLRVDRRRSVYAPNVFSPNGDGENDLFTLFGDQSVKSFRALRIYDRWGDCVYAAEDLSRDNPGGGWNGTNKGEKAPPGVYVYWVEIEYVDGETEVVKGDVTLLR
jgi:gliding motility-associated-like protein